MDELGEMPPSLQAKLLRVLQEGTFERVGGNQSLHSNARIIAATNRDLPKRIKEEHFREDLYYRLNVVHLHIPPLRERSEDLSLLTEHLLKRINAKQHTSVRHITENAWRRLKDYSWPGNIRELENVLTRAAVLARTDTITLDTLALPSDPEQEPEDQGSPNRAGLRLISLDEMEEEQIREILSHTRWHKGKACEILGISRPALERKITKYGLDAK